MDPVLGASRVEMAIRWLLPLLVGCLFAACVPHPLRSLGTREDPSRGEVAPASIPDDRPPLADGEVPELAARRLAMVDSLVRQGIRSPQVVEAMRTVPRHLFVPSSAAHSAYVDVPLVIGYGQTISAPYVVAYMTELLELRKGMKVLEIGTGSGYQAAVLAAIVGDLFSIEIIPELASEASSRLERLGFGGVRVRTGDGYYGWPEEAPFQAMIVTAAADHVPPPLLDQLARGGRMVIPVGSRHAVQTMLLITKDANGAVARKALLPVRFVPMTGRVERP